MDPKFKSIYSLDLTTLSELDPQGLNELIDSYPYAHNLYALKILALKAVNDPEFNRVLSANIVNIPDRVYLKGLVERLDRVEKEIKEKMEEDLPNKDSDLVAEDKVDLIIEEMLNLESEKPEPPEADLVDDIISEQVITDISEETEDMQIEEETMTVVHEDQEIVEIEEEELEPYIIKDQSTVNMEETKLDKTEIQLKDTDDSELSGFSLWLRNKSKFVDTELKHILLESSDEPDSKNEWEGLQEKILSDYNADKHKSKEKDQDKKKKKKLKNKIIETEVVTEPFAILLEQQGKISKAIKIYEKLSLIYPEKTTYFADKIEYLKNK